MIDLDAMMDLPGVFLLVLTGIELPDTINVYLKRNVVHVVVVVLVAIIAIALKVVVWKIKIHPGEVILGIAGLIIALAIACYLINKAGLFICDFNTPPVKEEVVMEYH